MKSILYSLSSCGPFKIIIRFYNIITTFIIYLDRKLYGPNIEIKKNPQITKIVSFS